MSRGFEYSRSEAPGLELVQERLFAVDVPRPRLPGWLVCAVQLTVAGVCAAVASWLSAAYAPGLIVPALAAVPFVFLALLRRR